ncbi:YkgJ family cysteine cluster protein [Chondromyces crocatus]|uniref:YkgJ family cysteine cluster protein n=1 Tax=Chondromyces crocatus TaxID=52 RepID=A0A0K1EDZ8_CHOCO|nr:YkgJ family cysteine cluster protein [Chondromyces crocatus]AKT39085.1 uncharacterized protein CMC5_032320 [Chondromyces crocatus]
MTDDGRRPPRALPLAQPTRYTPSVLEGIADGERAVLGPLFGGGEVGVIEAAAQALARADVLVQSAREAEPPPQPIACGPRCPSCCTSKVLVLVPEVLRLAAWLRANRTPEDLAELLERVRATDATTRGLSRSERAHRGIPCPLLDAEGSCSVHPARPLVCASWTSLDLAACQRHFPDPLHTPAPPLHAPGYEVVNAVMAGLGWAAKERGLDATPLELIAALRIALERPGAGARWLRKLPVFSTAHDPEWMAANGGPVGVP